MKEVIKYFVILFITLFVIWGISTSIPKVLDIYKNKPIEKVDTIIKSDTIYFEKTVTDTMPKYRYQTIVKYDTLYKWKAKGDSIEKIPVRMELKKKLPVRLYPLGMIH